MDPCLNYDMDETLHDPWNWEPDRGSNSAFQIFIKTPEGKSIIFWVQASENVFHLKQGYSDALPKPDLRRQSDAR